MIDITTLGAVRDGRTLATKAIQEAVDKAWAKGGDMVYIPSGDYVTGNIYLKDHVHIHMAVGARLLASPDLDHYDTIRDGHNKDRQPYHLFIADGCQDILIDGKGVISGNGPLFWQEKPDARGWYKEKKRRVSPLFEFSDCKDITLKEFTIQDAPGWTLHLNRCDRVTVGEVRILNHIMGPNTDAIDINGCRDVIIKDCHIEAGDDAIVLKTTPDARSCERVTVTNCLLRSNCVGLKLGATESFYDMRQITFSNCVIYKSTRPIGIYALEGGHMEDITITGIVADTHGSPTVGLGIPIHLDLRQRNDKSEKGSIRHIQISNFICRTDGKIMMTAQEGMWLKDIVLRDVHLIYDRGIRDARGYKDWQSAQFSNRSPEARVARTTMALEGVDGLYMENYQVTWPTAEAAEPSFKVTGIWQKRNNRVYMHNPLLVERE